MSIGKDRTMSELGFQRLQEQLKKLRQEAVTHPNQVMMQIKVPAEIAAALGTGRGGLVMLGGGWERPHSQEQMKDIYRLISSATILSGHALREGMIELGPFMVPVFVTKAPFLDAHFFMEPLYCFPYMAQDVTVLFSVVVSVNVGCFIID
jgi:hypothetical protein